MDLNARELPSKSALEREAAVTVPVYPQLNIDPLRAVGCEILTRDGRTILDLYGGHAVAALGYSHPGLYDAISTQSRNLLFQSNAVALDIRAAAAEALVAVAPKSLTRVFFVNSGAEANENALRVACRATGRSKILAITHSFHGRTAAAAAVTWKAANSWYGFPRTPFDVDFIPRNDSNAARRMIDDSVAAVIFEPVQGVAGAFDLEADFVSALRAACSQNGALLIADEVQSGMGRSGRFFASQVFDLEPDLLTSAKSLGGGFPCGALLCSETLGASLHNGDLGSTFGGGPVAAAAIVAVIDAIKQEKLLENVRQREAEIRSTCLVGPVKKIQGMGLLLGLVCDKPAREVHAQLLEHDILTGVSAASNVLRLLPPLVLQSGHVSRLAVALADMICAE
ncbi:MAG: aspartate aminotransferase family protein [Woeseia sp.]|nr:aminotransferase class III-fold pyridoxal phosphate-dependent enzyme [Woeseia sp.]MBT8095791.1 aminotransferase class III-fold pyridoxal phosphate-dependent enzyme [Woeseia sp.]NNE61759.1 aspartate aminotransferase family protein [Woeseia sp.]NNL54172.1 aspartate aminotransferase family protein [Woeseia sp.]